MESWKEYIKQAKAIKPFKVLDDIMKNNRVQEEVIRLNQEQLGGGVDVNEKVIKTIGGNPYRPRTILYKRSKGQPTDVVTLKDTGDFYNTFRLKVTNQGYEVIADFNKEDGNILDNFLSFYDFLGLTDESLAELAYETIYPRMSKIIRGKLNV